MTPYDVILKGNRKEKGERKPLKKRWEKDGHVDSVWTVTLWTLKMFEKNVGLKSQISKQYDKLFEDHWFRGTKDLFDLTPSPHDALNSMWMI